MPGDYDALIRVIEAAAAGERSDAVMEFTKPGHPEDVRRLAEAVGMLMVQVEAREFRLERLLAEKEAANRRLRRNALSTVSAMARAVGARDAYTKGHNRRVSAYAWRLGKRLGLDKEDLEDVRLAGLLHDIGKIGFADDIFHNETAKPDPEMYERIKLHPLVGAEILANLDFLGKAREYVAAHHERPDGAGYPRGLRGGDIPLGARILAVADVYDAVTTDRPYQRGMDREQAAAVLRGLAGTGLDGALAELFIEEIDERGGEIADDSLPYPQTRAERD